MPPTPPRYQAAIQATQRRLDQVVATGGIAPVRSLFAEVNGQLERDLAKLPGGTFDDARKRSAALQVRAAILRLNQASATIAEKGSIDAQVAAVQELATQVQGLERDFRGTVVPVPLLEAARFKGLAADRASSLLVQHRVSMARYGAETIREIEGVMARSLLGAQSNTEAIDAITETLGGSRWRAERIHRTEQAWSYNAGHVDGLVTQATTLPDIMMRWSEHVSDDGMALDDRVAVDSMAMHGQLVVPGGLFTQPPAAPDGEQVPDGLVLKTWAHPPNRPNDRAVIGPWRPHWGVPGWIWKDGRREPYDGGRVPEVSTREAPAATGGSGLPEPVAPAEIREEAGAPPPMPPRPPPAPVNLTAVNDLSGKAGAVLGDFGFGGGLKSLYEAQSPPPGFSIRATKASVFKWDGDDAVEIFGTIQAADGSEAGTFMRSVRRDGADVVVRHAILSVDPRYRGQGISDAMNDAAFAAYRKAGVARVELSADDVGRYQWMRLGFEVEPGSRRDIARAFHDWVRRQPKLAAHADALAGTAEEMLARPGGIADLDVAGVTIRMPGRDGRERDMPVGKAFLLTPSGAGGCPMYEAQLKIDDADPFFRRAQARLSQQRSAPMRSPGGAALTHASAPIGLREWRDTKGKLLAASAPTGTAAARVAAEARRRRPLADVMFAAVSDDRELGAVARGGLERVLRDTGIATPLDAPSARTRAAATIKVSQEFDTGGVHDWDGSIQIGRHTAGQVASMAGKLARGAGAEVTGSEVRSLNVLIHEQMHGATPISKDGYEGVGAMIEEVSTEALARRATRKLAAGAGVPRSQIAAGGVGAPRHDADGAYARELLQVRRAIQDVTGLGENDAYALLERASERLKSRSADPRQRGLSADSAADAFAADLAAELGDPAAAARFREAIASAPRQMPRLLRSEDDVARFEARYGQQRVEQRLAKLQEEQVFVEMTRFPTTMLQFEKEAEARIAAARGVEAWQLTGREIEQAKSEVAAERARREAVAAKAAAAEIDKDRATFAKIDRMVREGKIRVPPSAKLDVALSTKARTVSVIDEERQAIDREQRAAARTLASARSASDSSSWFEDVSVVPTDEDIAAVGLVKRGNTWIDPNDDDAALTDEEARNYWSDSEAVDDEEASKLRDEIETLRYALSDTAAPEEWDSSISTMEELVSSDESKAYSEEDPDEEIEDDHPEEMTPAQYRAALVATRDQMRRQAERAQAALERVHASQIRSRGRLKATFKELDKAAAAAVREVEKLDTDAMVVGDDEEGEAYAAAEFLLSTEIDDRNETIGISGQDDLDGYIKEAAAATARMAKTLAKITGRAAAIEKPAKKPKATKAKSKDDEEDDDE